MTNGSILWDDSTLTQDKNLIKFLVGKIVSGKDFQNHHEDCVKKIFENIQDTDWQQQYPSRTFVFSVFYALRVEGIIEIKFSLYAQALELLYFNLACADSHYSYHAEASFSRKFSYVFAKIYEWQPPHKTANALRILRNDVTHTGAIKGVVGASRNANDFRVLQSYFQEFDFDRNQMHTELQNRMHLAFAFTYLLNDMLVRVLGLTQEDMRFNITPAWINPIFGYDHENRPQWLR